MAMQQGKKLKVEKWVPKLPAQGVLVCYEARRLGRRLSEWAPNQGSLEDPNTPETPRWLKTLGDTNYKKGTTIKPGDTAWVATSENWT